MRCRGYCERGRGAKQEKAGVRISLLSLSLSFSLSVSLSVCLSLSLSAYPDTPHRPRSLSSRVPRCPGGLYRGRGSGYCPGPGWTPYCFLHHCSGKVSAFCARAPDPDAHVYECIRKNCRVKRRYFFPRKETNRIFKKLASSKSQFS